MLEPRLNETLLQEALRLAAQIYRLHEAGLPYGEQVASLSAVTGQDVTRTDVHAAFGSMSAEDWAHDLVCLSSPMPESLSRDDLIEMIRRVCDVHDAEWLQNWYIRCLENATGCPSIIDILDSPEELTPEEALDEALRSKMRILVTPPPEEEP